MVLKYTAYVLDILLLGTLTFLIFARYQKLSTLVKKGLIVSLMMILLAVALVNTFEDYIGFFKAYALNTQFVILAITVILFVGFGWLLLLLFKDYQKCRPFYFGLAVLVLIFQVIITTMNIHKGNGTFQAHLCRQMAYLLPTVYFSKYLRKVLLPYFCYGSFFGAYITLLVNLIIYTGIGFHQADSITTHMALGLSVAIMLKEREVVPKWWDVGIYTIGLALSTLLAHYANLLALRNSGAYGNNMYIGTMLIGGFIPTWLVGILSIVFVALLVLLFKAVERKKALTKST